MRITLLLNKVSHDQSADTAEDLAFIGWAHGPSAGADNDLISDGKLPFLSIREEDFGAVVIHGPSLRVFSVDHEALELLKCLKNGESLERIAASSDFSQPKTEEFVRLVKQYGIVSGAHK